MMYALSDFADKLRHWIHSNTVGWNKHFMQWLEIIQLKTAFKMHVSSPERVYRGTILRKFQLKKHEPSGKKGQLCNMNHPLTGILK